MEETVDAIIERIEELRESPEFLEIMEVGTETYFDDPGIVLINEYPFFFVQPVNDSSGSETMGITGYDVRTLAINVVLVAHVPSFFDPDTHDDDTSRKLVQAMNLVRKTLRTKSNLTLGGSVRRVMVASINYVPSIVEEGVFVKMAVMNLLVQKQYQHEA